jgi:gluconate 2-dehydrogenase gamma chain
MSHSARFDRRKFIQITAVATAAGPMVACLGHGNPWRCLKADEALTLEAVCERIIPADQDPGAAWAGVVNFIDRQLTGPYRRLQKTYRLGIEGIHATSLAMFGNPFVALTAEQQDAVLQAMDKGQAQGEGWKQLSAKSFFDLVVSHTMQGFYGDPRHGGNRERVSWKMLRLPYPPVRGRLGSQPSTDDADSAERKTSKAA